MARIIIAIPDKFLFSTHINVQIGDINYGNHLSNDAVLRLCHEARLRFLQSFGYSETNVAGTGLIMAGVMMKLINQAFYGDRLLFQVALSEIGKAGFSLITQIIRDCDQSEIARVKCDMVFFDYTKQIISRTPLDFINTFNPLLTKN